MDATLKNLAQKMQSKSLLQLFEQQPNRAEEFTIHGGGVHFDFSKNHITPAILKALCDKARSQNIGGAIEALFAGKLVNTTEQRAALHTTLRDPKNVSENNALVQETLDKMDRFVDAIHQKKWLGFSGKPITTIVNIGIGGSDLGPRVVTQALFAFRQENITLEFIANIDGADLADCLLHLNPQTTLFIVASKSFTTAETLSNAVNARQWMLDAGCEETLLHLHFVAISTNTKAAKEFGIAAKNIFPMWDWVGGRYSLWSAIGLPIALEIGMKRFRELLAGAHSMDMHFRDAPLEHNMPVIAALISYWYSVYWGASSHAILPYAQRLKALPAYLQQLDMESLGKRVTHSGAPVTTPTGSILWGTEGSNGQHSFHQLLHQGTHLIPCDFIAVKKPMSQYDAQHWYLLSCCLSQSQALLQGKTLAQATAELSQQGLDKKEVERLAAHKVIPGNRPSNIIIMDELTPANLGELLAFYEHKVYATSVLLDINAFDQWGVQLGKELNDDILRALDTGEINPEWDNSTIRLINYLRFTKQIDALKDLEHIVQT
jgi:glucose-6-phosphate isomerase